MVDSVIFRVKFDSVGSVSAAALISSSSVSMKILVRIPAFLNFSIIPFSSARLSEAFHPALLVNTCGGSGTGNLMRFTLKLS